jgi:hypothetical protein
MIDTLRKMHPNNHQAVLDMVISHQGLPHKIELVKRILSTLVLPAPVPYRSLLRRFAALSSKGTADVAVRARQLLVSLSGHEVAAGIVFSRLAVATAIVWRGSIL